MHFAILQFLANQPGCSLTLAAPSERLENAGNSRLRCYDSRGRVVEAATVRGALLQQVV
jgi:hypothetical protein